MKPIELEVFFHTENTSNMKALDIDYPMTDCDIRNVTFYSIEHISPWIDTEGTEYCEITSGGQTVISSLSYLQVKELIQKNIEAELLNQIAMAEILEIKRKPKSEYEPDNVNRKMRIKQLLKEIENA